MFLHIKEARNIKEGTGGRVRWQAWHRKEIGRGNVKPEEILLLRSRRR